MSRLCRFLLVISVVFGSSEVLQAQSTPESIVPPEVRVQSPSRAMGIAPNVRHAAPRAHNGRPTL